MHSSALFIVAASLMLVAAADDCTWNRQKFEEASSFIVFSCTASTAHTWTVDYTVETTGKDATTLFKTRVGWAYACENKLHPTGVFISDSEETGPTKGSTKLEGSYKPGSDADTMCVRVDCEKGPCTGYFSGTISRRSSSYSLGVGFVLSLFLITSAGGIALKVQACAKKRKAASHEPLM